MLTQSERASLSLGVREEGRRYTEVGMTSWSFSASTTAVSDGTLKCSNSLGADDVNSDGEPNKTCAASTTSF